MDLDSLYKAGLETSVGTKPICWIGTDKVNPVPSKTHSFDDTP